jgi:hypothetical protein
MKVLKAELKRAFGSMGFWVGTAGTVIAGFAGGFDAASQAATGALNPAMGPAALQVVQMALISDLFVLTVPILCTLAYAASFVEEKKSRYIHFYLPRAGRKSYLFSKISATALSGGAAVFLGAHILLLIYAASFRDSSGSGGEYALTYGTLLMHMTLLFINGCLWALIGGIAAAATKNKYMAYACPFIFFYVLTSFQKRYYGDLLLLSPHEWIYPKNIAWAAAYPAVLLAFAAAFAGYFLLMKWRLRDG